jgi:hypothetical protein
MTSKVVKEIVETVIEHHTVDKVQELAREEPLKA